MNGHCTTCERDSECGYKYKPADCCDYRKFVPIEKPEEEMIMTVELLAAKLKQLNDCEEAKKFVYTDDLGDKYVGQSVDFDEKASPELKKLLDEVDALACGELITSTGNGNNYTSSKKLKDLGFPVKRGEYDSFGWLSGVIVMDNFFYVYG